jgi:putative ABC transport system substrate-binding protein
MQFDQLKRRTLITLLGGAAAWPLVAHAQQGKGPVRLGFLPLGSPTNAYDLSLVEAFQQGLRRVGLIENRDIILDVAWISRDPDQTVSEVLRRGAELLIPCGSSASVAAKRQTSTIPSYSSASATLLLWGWSRACHVWDATPQGSATSLRI